MGHFLYNLIWTWTPNFSSFRSFSCSLWTAFTLLLWFKNILKILKNLHLQNEIPPNPKHDEKRGHERSSGHCLVQGWSSCNHTATSPGINPQHKNIISPLCTCQKTVQRGRNNDCWIKPNSSGSVPNVRLKEKKPPMDNQRLRCLWKTSWSCT